MFKAFKMLVLPALAVAVMSCGGSAGTGGIDFPDDVVTNVPPIISSIAPTTGPVGTVVVVSGIGFSNIPTNNIIIMDDASTAATAHDYLPSGTATSTDFETITFTVPADAPLGDVPVVVNVGVYASDDNVTFTVTP